MIIWYNWIFGTTSGFAQKSGIHIRKSSGFIMFCHQNFPSEKLPFSLGVFRHVFFLRVAIHGDHHHLGVVGHHGTIWEQLGNALIDTWPLKSAVDGCNFHDVPYGKLTSVDPENDQCV